MPWSFAWNKIGVDIAASRPTCAGMGARNFSLAHYGAADDSSATGLYIGKISYGYKADKIDLKNHLSCTVGFTLSDDMTDVKLSGAVITKTAGMTPALASVISLANTSANSLTLTTKGIFSTPVGTAGIVVIGATLERANSEFETGDIDAVYHPGAAVNAPVSLT